MFGYVRPLKSELLVRQAEYYRAAYCGLCRSMRRVGGLFSSFSLSYDFALLTVMRTSLGGELPKIEAARCIVHPLKKRPSFKESSATLYCASAAVILTYRKLLDDIADERGKKRLLARLAKPTFARGRRRVLKRYPELSELDEKIGELLNGLSKVEKGNIPSADVPAGIFGEILGEICAFGLDRSRAVTAKAFGRAIGHWIYLVDAADDMSEDHEKGEYNPLIALYGDKLSESDKKWVANALISKLMDAEAAFDLMDMGEDADAVGIIKNILYRGLPKVGEEILSEGCDRHKEGFCRGCGA